MRTSRVMFGAGARIAVVVGLAVALGACGDDDYGGGGGGSDETQVSNVVERYAQAVAGSDQPGACELLTDDVKQTIDQQSGRACQAFVTNVAGAGDVAGVKVTGAAVDGSTATATATGAGGVSLQIELTKDGGDWKIDDADDADLGVDVPPSTAP